MNQHDEEMMPHMIIDDGLNDSNYEVIDGDVWHVSAWNDDNKFSHWQFTGNRMLRM